MKILILILSMVYLYSADLVVKNNNYLLFNYGRYDYTTKTIDQNYNIIYVDNKSTIYHRTQFHYLVLLTSKANSDIEFKISGKFEEYKNTYSEIYIDSPAFNMTELKSGRTYNVEDMTLNYYFSNVNVLTTGIIDVSRGKNSKYISNVPENSPIYATFARGHVEGIFFSHYDNKYNYKIGYGEIGLFDSNNKQTMFGISEAEGANHIFFYNDYKINNYITLSGNIIYTTDIYYSKDINLFKIKNLPETINIGNTIMIGADIVYNNDTNLFYLQYGKMYRKLNLLQLTPNYQPIYINDIEYDDLDISGSEITLGAQKYYNIPYFHYDMYYGIEYYKTFDDYTNFVSGNQYINYGVQMVGHQYSLYSHVDICRSKSVSILYQKSYIDGNHKLFSALIDDKPRTAQNIKLQFMYKF